MGRIGKKLYGTQDIKQANNNFQIWIVIFLVVLSSISTHCLITKSKAAPIIIDEDSNGYWEDYFEDNKGIETWDNIELNMGEIRLMDMLYENFTGPTGTYPDDKKWDIIHQGGTFEINNNRMRSSDSPPYGTWHNMKVQTKSDFKLPHTLTWRQQLQTVGGGMYYHFRVQNASSGNSLLGIYQNYLGNYGVYNYYTSSGTSMGSSVSGWHDYKVTFNGGYLEIYMDDVLKFSYDYFDVQSVRYQIGMDILDPASATIYTDDIQITSGITSGNLTSTEIVIPKDQTWESLEVDKLEPVNGNTINVSVLDGITFLAIPGFDNLNASTINLSSIDPTTYPTIRLKAHFTGYDNRTPVLYGWKVTWADTIAPSPPSGLTVNDPYSGDSLNISWDPNPEPDVVYYYLDYSTDNVTFYRLANIDKNTFSFIHSNLLTGIEYYYKIAAVDEIPNQSPFSEVKSTILDIDSDGDGIGNRIDDDIDGDTVPNSIDEYPYNENEWIDSDGDGIADNADLDDDNDSYDDTIDDFPFNSSEWKDTDCDGIGNNADLDDDNDGIPDISDMYPFNDANDIEERIDDLSAELTSVNDSLFNRISETEINILNRLDNLNWSPILNYIEGMNDSLSSEIQDILNSITDDVIELNSSLSDELTMLLDSLKNDNDALRAWLELVTNELNSQLTAASDILYNQSNELDDSDNNIEIINNTLANLTKLDNILSQLLDLDSALKDVNDDLKTKAEDKSKEEEIEDRIRLLEFFIFIVLLLLIVNLVVTSISLLRKKIQKDTKISESYNKVEPEPLESFTLASEPEEPKEIIKENKIKEEEPTPQTQSTPPFPPPPPPPPPPPNEEVIE
ncbi:MAG: fibronectin type III domain-containing protein [Thermoplasmata archaeon]|nr:MAG: fibronectin type III domain-containing protein [Thermoplasmata archaeon]